jgi:hypothetical protein
MSNFKIIMRVTQVIHYLSLHYLHNRDSKSRNSAVFISQILRQW